MSDSAATRSNHLQQCEDIIAAAPDDWAIARLFLPRERRPAATALLALRQELRRIPTSSEEPGIVNMKLQWWRDEIMRLPEGTPQHPVMKVLREHLEGSGIEHEYLLEMADASDMEFDAGGIRNEADRQLYLYRSSGVVAELFARMASGLDRKQLRAARSIGLARGQLDVMQSLAIDIARNCLRIPLEALAAQEIAPAALAQADADRRNALLKTERDILDRLRVQARTHMADAEPIPALRVIWRRLEDDYRRLPAEPGSLAVTPPDQPGMLRRLWTAWRAARRPINS